MIPWRRFWPGPRKEEAVISVQGKYDPPGNGPEEGPVKEGEEKEGSVKEGEEKEGSVREGEEKEGPVREGEEKEGPVKEGEVKEGEGKAGPVKEGQDREEQGKEGEQPPTRIELLLSKIFERVGMVVVSLFVFFLLAECVTRIVDRIVNDVPMLGADERNVLYREHPYLFRVPRPKARFATFEVNSHGFRGREFKIPKPPGVFRILTLGGSAAWDTDVSGTQATWAVQLEDYLNARRKPFMPRFEVVNGGVPGYNSAESYMNFMWRGLRVQPDAVIVYQGYNDFKPNRYPGFRMDYSHYRWRDHSTLRILARRSRFLFYFHKLLGRMTAYRGKVYDTVTEPGIRAYRENLRRIVLLARDKKIQPILSTFAMSVTLENKKRRPDKYRGVKKYVPTLSFKGLMDAHKKYNQAVRSLAREMKVPLADVDAAVPKTFEYFHDHCHFEDKGSARAARAFGKVVLQELVIPDGARGSKDASPSGSPD